MVRGTKQIEVRWASSWLFFTLSRIQVAILLHREGPQVFRCWLYPLESFEL